MYVYKRQVSMQRGIATLLALALVLWAGGSHMFTKAEAANLTYVKDTLSDSDTGSVSDHTIEFLSPTGVAAGETIVITFPAGFDLSAIDEGDIDLAIAGVDQTVAAAPSGATWGATVVGQVVTLESGNGTIGSNATATITIGTDPHVTGGDAQITNPGLGSYSITIAAGASDNGTAMVAIVDNVLVTAEVDTTLTFTVNGTSTGVTVNGSGTTTATTTTSNTLPFGTLVSGTSKTLGQDLTVATNARNGYVVTVEQDQNLLSSTGADIDGFIDGGYDDTPTAWVRPSNDINDENTWGHWGLTSTDSTLLGAGADFGSDEWVAASTTPRAIMAHNGPSDGATELIGRATIGYQIEISALQEAGDDYSTTLTYIATPTF